MLKLELREIAGKLPTSIFNLVDDKGSILGFVQVRHKVSAGMGVPKECASHIYYEVNPDKRGLGYGKILLKLALEEAQKIGLHPVIVTCDEDNLASKKIIESNGGVYICSCKMENERQLLKYRFE